MWLCATHTLRTRSECMKYHLDYEIRLSEESENDYLDSWALVEINKKGKKVGNKLQVPLRWHAFFTASELRTQYSCSFDKYGTDDGKELSTESETIIAILHPGICHNGEMLEDNFKYSMFGTDREIKKFMLRIEKLKDDKDEMKCRLWGCVSYTSDTDFIDETTDDCIEIYLFLPTAQFNKIAGLIKNGHVDISELSLMGVSGFYTEWSPLMRPYEVKVLTSDREHVVANEAEYEISPPRLGKVSKITLSLLQRNKLNIKQDLDSIDIDKLFYEFDNSGDEILENEHIILEESPSAWRKLVTNKQTLNSSKIPIWLIFIVLCLYLVVK